MKKFYHQPAEEFTRKCLGFHLLDRIEPDAISDQTCPEEARASYQCSLGQLDALDSLATYAAAEIRA